MRSTCNQNFCEQPPRTIANANKQCQTTMGNVSTPHKRSKMNNNTLVIWANILYVNLICSKILTQTLTKLPLQAEKDTEGRSKILCLSNGTLPISFKSFFTLWCRALQQVLTVNVEVASNMSVFVSWCKA